LIRLLDVGTPAQQLLVRTAIENGEGDFTAVAAAIRDSDALVYTRDRAIMEADAAVTALADYPISSFRDSLIEFRAFAINRDR
jgi:octaprenyl-diphosphate synthase